MLDQIAAVFCIDFSLIEVNDFVVKVAREVYAFHRTEKVLEFVEKSWNLTKNALYGFTPISQLLYIILHFTIKP